MKTVAIVTCITILCSSCSTMNQSFQLGAALGGLGGTAATYAAYSSVTGKATLENVAMGAGIGIGIGLITAYLTHKAVEEDRGALSDSQPEMHFGDLPPSPFVTPRKPGKKGDN